MTAQPWTFAGRLRARRLELALSATFVARQTGTSRGTIYRIERGLHKASASLDRRLRTLLDLDGARLTLRVQRPWRKTTILRVVVTPPASSRAR